MLQFLKKLKLRTKLVLRKHIKTYISEFICNQYLQFVSIIYHFYHLLAIICKGKTGNMEHHTQ